MMSMGFSCNFSLKPSNWHCFVGASQLRLPTVWHRLHDSVWLFDVSLMMFTYVYILLWSSRFCYVILLCYIYDIFCTVKNFSVGWSCCPSSDDPAARRRCRFPWSSKQRSAKMRPGPQAPPRGPQVFGYPSIGQCLAWKSPMVLMRNLMGISIARSWNDERRMILMGFDILMLMLIHPARYFAVFIGTSWRHWVLRVSKKAKHRLNRHFSAQEIRLRIHIKSNLGGGLEHDFHFSKMENHPNWRYSDVFCWWYLQINCWNPSFFSCLSCFGASVAMHCTVFRSVLLLVGIRREKLDQKLLRGDWKPMG